MSRLRLYALGAALVLLLAIAGCTTTDAPVDEPSTETPGEQPADSEDSVDDQASSETGIPADRARGEIRVATNSQIATLVPGLDSESAENQVMSNVFDFLVRFKPGTSELEGRLAESWEQSEDGMQLTFHLREGVQFHHGYGELTSEDVAFSLLRHQDPDFTSRYAQDFSVIESIDTPDPHTVVINFTQPSPGFLTSAIAYRGAYIVSKKAVEELGDEFNFNPVGTGPFEVESVNQGVETVLRAHEEHWQGRPASDRVVMKPIPDPLVAWAALQAGDIDLTYTRSGEVYTLAKEHPDFVVETRPSQSVRGLFFHWQRSPTDDVRVRRALAHAIDKQSIVEFALDGTGEVASSVIAPATWSWTDDIPTYEFDQDRALELLAEAGYPNGEGLNLLFSYAFQDPYQILAPVIQEQLSEVGITVELDGRERQAWGEYTHSGNYHITTIGLTRPQDPEIVFVQGYHSGSFPPGANYSWYDNADDLIEAVRTTVDPEARMEASHAVQRKLAEDVASLPIYYAYSIAIRHPNLVGHNVGIINDMDLFRAYFKE